MYQGTKVAKYEIVSRDKIITLNNQKFRIILYGAINAGGLIGPEMNGIAILNEEEKTICADGFERIDSGYFGPSSKQIEKFEEVCKMNFIQLQALVNTSKNCYNRI